MSGATLQATPTGDGEGVSAARMDCLYVVIQASAPRAPVGRFALGQVDEVVLGRGPLGVRRDGQRLIVSLDDARASSAHARLTKKLGRWLVEDLGSTNGTVVNGDRIKQAALGDGDVLEVGRTFLVFRELVAMAEEDEAILLSGKPAARRDLGFATLVPSLARQLRSLAQIAASPVSVVLRGESGTGKEVAARGVHELSGRKGELVAVNCGALPRELVESALFGHKKGAFSGAASDSVGLVRTADGGSLFLDEIGDLPLQAQAALLRVLQEHVVMPVGGLRATKVDLRVIAATHRDLAALVAAGGFRADLLARLSGFTLELPPLRERLEDVGLIVGALLQRLDAPPRTVFHPRAVRGILAAEWSANIRELEKALSAAIVLCGGEPIDAGHLKLAERPVAAAASNSGSTTDEQRRVELVALLREHKGNVHAVARAMGKARMQVQRWLKRFQLDAKSFR